MELLWVMLLGLPITLPGRFLPTSMQSYIVIALFLFWPLRWFNQRWLINAQKTGASNKPKLDTDTPLKLALLCLLAWLPVNLWMSADIQVSWIAAGYLLFGIALYTALVHCSPCQWRLPLSATFLLLIGSGLALASPLLVAWKPDFRIFQLPLYNRLQSIPYRLSETMHANVLAGALVIVLPLLVALMLGHNWTTRPWLRYLCNVLTFIVLAVLILTQSRGAYLAIGIALPLVIILRWPWLVRLAPLVILAAIISIRFIAWPMFLDQSSSDGSLGGWDVRLDIWTHSLQALSDFVYTGIGIGTFTLVMPLLYPLRYPIEGYPHAHNLFLQIGVDLGLPGLIAYLALLINLFVMLFVVLRTRQSVPLHRTLAIGATGSLVAMLVHGLLDAVTWGTKLAFMPWLLFALITLLFFSAQTLQPDKS